MLGPQLLEKRSSDEKQDKRRICRGKLIKESTYTQSGTYAIAL